MMALPEPKGLKPAIIIALFIFTGVNAICKPGWLKHGLSCYKVTDHKMTWEDAGAYCQGLNGALLVIESADENNFIAAAFRDLKVKFVWLGCSDQDTEGEWVCYPEGVKIMAYEKWAIGEPNNWKQCQHCAVVNIKHGGGEWGDKPCTIKYRTICETNYTMSCYILGFDGRLHP